MASKGADLEQENEILDWMETIMGEKLPRGNFGEDLKNGVILCRFINKLAPDSIPEKKIATSGGGFKLRENVERFQKAIVKYGVPQEEIFVTVDLFEKKNLKQVRLTLLALGRIAQNKGQPGIGPKMSDENKRNFSEEQIRQGRDAQIGLQAGSNKGASQAGINMGKQRMIQD
ncbi:unnamed protein product [Owenia fusiformis]|uniref:Calponin n=1 Tax=Owenia fusiformis TaxID=6347 RepID=A0A8J1XI46_OWEFU|nr:unnamed protein product [Owenia fusiformis]